MKVAKPFRILQFTLKELYLAGSKTKDGIEVPHSALREILLQKVRPSLRSTVSDSDSAAQIAPKAAGTLPYCGALRQIYLCKERENPQRIEQALTGPDDPNYYLFDIISVDMNEMPNLDRHVPHLLEGLILETAEKEADGSTENQAAEQTVLSADHPTEQSEKRQIVRFVLFERSASQQRQNQLVMIREELYTPDALLRERIRCGLPEIPEVIASKYAAYRALLLTSGICVPAEEFQPKQAEPESQEENSTFNLWSKDSVIVISDFQLKNWREECQKRKIQISDSETVTSATVKSVTDEQNRQIINITYSEQEDKTENDKLFDGEGLISREFGEFLAKQIDSPHAASFQIRMPFVKGLVHSVDFHRMFRSLYGNEDVSIRIRDAFGVKRDLSKVHIILTVSMFKMYKLYHDMFPKSPDSKKYEAPKGYAKYWEAFRAGEHQLFVSGCDENYRRQSGQTAANYQFLSTLDLSASDADGEKQRALLGHSVRTAWTAVQSDDSAAVSYLQRARMSLIDKERKAGSEEEGAAPTEIPEYASDAELLRRCPQLARTEVFRERMDQLSLRKSLSVGHILMPGIIRYLSGDLLQLCCLIAARLMSFDSENLPRNTKETIEKTKTGKLNHWMREAANELKPESSSEQDVECRFYFYAPDTPKQMPAVINRNPHLARNEHVPAVPIKCSKIRNRYFRHLRGTVMIRVGADRCVQRLGGADFDGDIVRLFYDRTYFEAALPSRKMHALKIPDSKAKDEAYTEEVRKDLIVRASGSRVGRFSNLAFKTSLFAYGARTAWSEKPKKKAEQNGAEQIAPEQNTAEPETVQQEAQKDLVKLSCVVGMEIDAAKAGVRPDMPETDLVIADQNSSAGDRSEQDPFRLDYFLNYKDSQRRKKQDKPISFPALDPKLGTYSMPEMLPYVFQPSRISFDPKAVTKPEWAVDFHTLLWNQRADGAFRPARDDLTAIARKRTMLCELIDLNGTPSAPPLLADAWTAVRAYEMICEQDSVPRSTDNGTRRQALRRQLCRLYGTEIGTKRSAELENLTKQFTDEEYLIKALHALIPWKRLPHAELRRQRLNTLLGKNSIEYTCEPDSAFDKYCCQLTDGVPDSALAAGIVLRTQPSDWDTDTSALDDDRKALRDTLLQENSFTALHELAEQLKDNSGVPLRELCRMLGIKLLESEAEKLSALSTDVQVQILQDMPSAAESIKKIRRECLQYSSPHISEERLNALTDEQAEQLAIENINSHTNTDMGSLIPVADRLRIIASILERKPEIDWMLESNEAVREDYLIMHIWGKRNIPDTCRRMLAEPENWQLLPLFLEYARAVCETNRRRTCQEQFQQALYSDAVQELFPNLWTCLQKRSKSNETGADNVIQTGEKAKAAQTTAQIRAEEIVLLQEAVREIQQNVPAVVTQRSEDAKLLSMLEQIPLEKCCLDKPEKLKNSAVIKIENEQFPDCAVLLPSRAVLLFCLLRLAKFEQLGAREILRTVLETALDANADVNTQGRMETDNDSGNLSERIVKLLLAAENGGSCIQTEPQQIERFLYRNYSDILLRLLPKNDAFELVQTEHAFLTCDALDGSQGIMLRAKSYTAPKSLASLAFEITVQTHIGATYPADDKTLGTLMQVKQYLIQPKGVKKSAKHSAEQAKQIKIEFVGTQQDIRLAKTLYLYSVPFQINITVGGQDGTILTGALTALRPPDDPDFRNIKPLTKTWCITFADYPEPDQYEFKQIGLSEPENSAPAEAAQSVALKPERITKTPKLHTEPLPYFFCGGQKFRRIHAEQSAQEQETPDKEGGDPA